MTTARPSGHPEESPPEPASARGELPVYILHTGTAADDFSLHVRTGSRIDALLERPHDLVLYGGRSDIERQTLVARVLEAVLAASDGDTIEHAAFGRLRNVVERLPLRINPDLVRLATSWDGRDVPVEGYSGRDRTHDILPADVRNEISTRGGPFLPTRLRTPPPTRSKERRRWPTLERLAPGMILSPLALVAGELSMVFGGAPSLTGALLALGSTAVAIGVVEGIYRVPDTLPRKRDRQGRWADPVPDGDYGAVRIECRDKVYRLSFPPTRLLERSAGRLGGLRDEKSGEWLFSDDCMREVRALLVSHLVPAGVRWGNAIMPTVSVVFTVTCFVMLPATLWHLSPGSGLGDVLASFVYLGAGAAASATAYRMHDLTERLFVEPAQVRTRDGAPSALSSLLRDVLRP